MTGIPSSVEQAEALFLEDPHTFQSWLVERVGGFPSSRRTGDRGIDGKIFFETSEGLEAVVLSVKGGNISPKDVRDLRGVLERESDAKMAGFLSLRDPTRGVLEEAASAGMYEYRGVRYPRIQCLTVRDVLEGRRMLVTPTRVGTRGGSRQGNLAFG